MTDKTARDLADAVRANTLELRDFREEMRGLRKELLPVVQSINAAGGVTGLIEKVKEYAPLIKKLTGFLGK